MVLILNTVHQIYRMNITMDKSPSLGRVVRDRANSSTFTQMLMPPILYSLIEGLVVAVTRDSLVSTNSVLYMARYRTAHLSSHNSDTDILLDR